MSAVSTEVISTLVRYWLAREGYGDRLGWCHVEDAYRLVYRWAALDESRVPDAREIIKTLDLSRLPKKVLGDIALNADLICSKRLLELYGARAEQHDALDVRFENRRQYGDEFMSPNLRFVAVHDDRVAVVDCGRHCVWVFNQVSSL